MCDFSPYFTMGSAQFGDARLVQNDSQISLLSKASSQPPSGHGNQSFIMLPSGTEQSSSAGNITDVDLYFQHAKLPFPWKLHDMLNNVDKVGQQHIVSWQPHGRAFRVHRPKEFVNSVLPQYFNQTKYKSFQRQLHMYGFQRILQGADKGAYYHDLFVLGKKHLCLRMTRCKIKGTKGKETQALKQDPDFYSSIPQKASNSTLDSDKLDHRPIAAQVSYDEISSLSKQPFSKRFSLVGASSRTDNATQSALNETFPTQNEQLHDGDMLFFAGKQFFFVENYHADQQTSNDEKKN